MQTYQNIGKPRETLKLSAGCIRLARETALPTFQAACEGTTGNAHYALGEYSAANEALERSLALNERRAAGHDFLDVAISLGNLGNVALALGESARALAYYQRSLAIKQRLFADGDHASVAWSLDSIGAFHGEMAEHLKAIEYRDMALR